MAYTPLTWIDEVLADDERYDIKDDGGTPINSTVQIALSTSVSVAGTPVNATNMNHIEQGIKEASISNRQGGDPTDFHMHGTTNYVPTNQKIQIGVGEWSSGGAPANSGSFTITFPVAFSDTPMLFLNCMINDSNSPIVFVVTVISNSTAEVSWTMSETGASDVQYSWMAIGPA